VRRRRAARAVACTLPGVLALALDHLSVGVALLAAVAVPAWAHLVMRQLRGVTEDLGPGGSVRLSDGTLTPLQAARMEGWDTVISDLTPWDGGGGGSGS